MKFTEEVFAPHMRPITGSAIREILKLCGRPGMISFAGGNPSNSALEPDVIARLSSEVLAKYGTQLLQYGATDGFAPLRESAAQFLNDSGVKCTPEMLLPVQGGSQAFDLLLKALIEPGDVILCESPTFLGAIQAMREYDARLIAMPMDDDGICIDAAEALIREHHPKMMYVIPTFQNPTGITLSLERRKALAQLASKYGVVIAEDDPYRDLRYAGTELPSIQSFDEEGWVVYMSSFSKYISPGMRLGAAVANPLLLRKMVIGKQSADVHSPMLIQAIIDAYLREGRMPAHLERIRADYRRQLDAMLEGFAAFPDSRALRCRRAACSSGQSCPRAPTAWRCSTRRSRRGVAFVPGTHFYPDGGHENTMRLNFSMSEIPAIREGMARLAKVIAEVCK